MGADVFDQLHQAIIDLLEERGGQDHEQVPRSMGVNRKYQRDKDIRYAGKLLGRPPKATE